MDEKDEKDKKDEIVKYIETNTCFAVQEIGNERITPKKIQDIFVYNKIDDPCSICAQGTRMFSLFSFLYDKNELGFGYINISNGCGCFESGGSVGLFKEKESIEKFQKKMAAY